LLPVRSNVPDLGRSENASERHLGLGGKRKGRGCGEVRRGGTGALFCDNQEALPG